MNFSIRHCIGDDNNQVVSNLSMDGVSAEKILSKLEKEFIAEFQGNPEDLTIDGDDTSLLVMWEENDIPNHSDYFIEVENKE